MKNIVQIKHLGDNFCRPYIFKVPLDITLKEGDIVIVKNRYGCPYGECITDSLLLSDQIADKVITMLLGKGKEITGEVLGKCEREMF